VVNFTGRHVRLRHAEDGDLIFGYDSLDPDHRLGLEPDRHAAELVAAGLLPFDEDRAPTDLAVAALDVAGTITGLPLSGPPAAGSAAGSVAGSVAGSAAGSVAGSVAGLGRGVSLGELLAGRLVGGRLLPLLADPVAVPARWPVRVDPGLVAKVAYATEEQLRPALVAQARRRVAATGLDAYPEVVAALDEAAAGPTRQADADSALGLVLRRICAEAQAAFGVFRDREYRHLISTEEREAWQARAAAAKAVHVLLAGPASAAVYEVLGPPDRFDDRDTFLAALSAVEPPPDAVARLEEHQQAQARTGRKLPVRFSRIRRV
jgi:hypothetical protein